MPRHERRPTRLHAERLEGRDTPAVTIQFDYRYDTLGFFNDPARRAALDQAAAAIAPRLQDSLSAIRPDGTFNTWQVTFTNPGNGAQEVLTNQQIPADTLVVYALGAPLQEAELGEANSGFVHAQGSASFLGQVFGRGQAGARATPATDYAPWGGFLTFDTAANWSFATAAPGRTQDDFLSVAEHELIHLLGFTNGVASFERYAANGRYTGPAVTALTGGPVSLTAEGSHWAAGTTYGGQTPTMVASISPGQVQRTTALDLAVLQDIGWQVSGGVPGVPPPPPSTSDPAPTPTSPLGPGTTLWPAGGPPLAVGGDGIGVASLFGPDLAARVTVAPLGSGFTGGVRVAAADVNGDGVADLIAGSGPGGPGQVVVVDGKTGALLAKLNPFEAAFTGGVYVAAGDVNGDGKADLVVTPDRGGGPRVRVYRGGDFALLADFLGINDPAFRGGARAAVGDVDGDGLADVVVSAGFLGGPRVAGYTGAGLAAGRPAPLFADFFAFETGLRNGAFVALGDVTGDGKADLVFGGGPGGAPRVRVVNGAGLLAAGGSVSLDARPDLTVANFFAGDPSGRGGVRVATKDFDGDGLADVAVGAGDGAGSRVTAYYGKTLRAGDATQAFNFDALTGVTGVYVG